MPIRIGISKDVFPTLLLLVCAIAAFVIVNTSLESEYHHILDFRFAGAPLHFIINDILMAIFFLAVGCEIKRELVIGELSTLKRALFPVVGAIGGMLIPALIYIALNINHPESIRGWAIPSATDIAFSLGVLGFFANSVPHSMRIFLTALAIVDDLGAVLIIALFFTGELVAGYLGAIAALALILFLLNRRGIRSLMAYLLLAPMVWHCFHSAGIHATVAGVFLAMFIPSNGDPGTSPLEKLEHCLIPWIRYAILPLFAFANSGVSVNGMSPSLLLDPVPLGVTFGLFFGKQIGVFGMSYLANVTGIANKPEDSSWFQLFSVAALTGIGFTMSLFIAGLAFPGDLRLLVESKLGIFAGSILSAIVGMFLLMLSSKKKSIEAI